MSAGFDFFNVYIMGIIQMLTGFYFFTKFLVQKTGLLYYLLFAISSAAVIIFIENSLAVLIIYALLLFISGVFVYKKEIVPVILYAAIIVEILQICYGIFNSLIGILFPFIFCLDNKVSGILFIIIGNLALPFSVFCYKVLYKYFSYNGITGGHYTAMALVPVLMLFLAGRYIDSKFYGNTGTIESILNTKHLYLFLIQLLEIADIGFILFAYKKLLENFNLNKELSLLLQQEHFLKQYVEEARINYNKTKALRHDIKNHIIIIKELLDNGKTDQALSYASDIEKIAEKASFQCNTNNPATDILLGNKLGMAKSYGIDVFCSLMLPYPCTIRDIDFCIILSNMLDNAINACIKMKKEEERYIYVTGRIQGKFILIEVKNTFNGKKIYKESTGMSNIRAAASKYNGKADVSVQDKTFTISVLLVIP